MELILKQDVDNLGFKDDLVTVKNGYGRNFLIPKGYAVFATKSAKKVLNETLKQRIFKESKIVEEAKKNAELLRSLTLKIYSKASKDKAKLFGSVTNIDLQRKLEEKNIVISKKFIKINGGIIKKVGLYSASVRFHRQVITDFSFEVVAEEN